MDKKDLLTNNSTVEEDSLNQLHNWLENKKYTLVLGAGVIFIPYTLVLTVLLIMAAIFTPFMLWHLHKARWHKSVCVFFAVVILPFIFFQFIHPKNSIMELLLTSVPLLFFFIYTWILGHMVEEHLTEIQSLKNFKAAEYIRK